MKLRLNKNAAFFWILIVLAYLLTRLVNLKIIPIFTDEAIYSYWAQVALHDPQHRFISLEDGKQPLFIWFAALSQRFVMDPLIATRLVSTLAGFGSIVGIYFVAKNIFGELVAKISTILYLVVPFTVMYDRLGIYDSLLTMLGLVSVYISIKMVKKPSLGLAQLNGYAIGLATITKSSGNFFLYLLPFSLLVSNKKMVKENFLKWVLLTSITFVISMVIYNSLRLSPLFYMIARKNLEFIRSPQEVLKDPFAHFTSNFNAIFGWLATYLSIPLFIVFLFSVFVVIYKRSLKGAYLLALIAAPLMAELLFNKVLYTRFVLFYLPYILILIAYSLHFIQSKFNINIKYKLLVFALLLILPTINSLLLITKPTSAKIPKNDADQYLNSWPAGYGVEEVIKIIKNESESNVVYVGTEGTFGLLPYALNIYFYQNKNVEIRAFWPLNPEDLPQQLLDLPKLSKTYLILYQTQKLVKNPKLKLIESYRQGIGDSYLRLYEVSQ